MKPVPERPRPRWWGHALRILIGAGVLAALIGSGALNPALLRQAITERPGLCLAALAFYLLPIQITAYFRWLWLLRRARVDIGAGQVLRLHLTGIFFNGILPGGTGGDLVKGYYLLRGRSPVEAAAALGTMVVDRFAGLFGLLAVGVAANILGRQYWGASPLLATQATAYSAIAGGCLLLALIYFSPWKPGWFPSVKPGPETGFWKGLLASFTAFRDAPRVFAGVVVLSAAVHFGLVLVYVLCAAALQVELPFSAHAYVAPTLTLLNGIPISPAGLGVGEAAGAVLYKAVGASHGHTEIPALVHAVVLLSAALCAPAYLLRGKDGKAARGGG